MARIALRDIDTMTDEARNLTLEVRCSAPGCANW